MTPGRLENIFAASQLYPGSYLALGFDILTLPFQAANVAFGFPPIYIPPLGGPEEGPPTPATLQSVVVTPNPWTAGLGEAVQFLATGYYSDGSQRDLTSALGITWSSSDSAVAQVSTSGLVQALGVGAATITATVSGGLSGSASLTVTPLPPPALLSINLSPAALTLNVGETAQLLALGSYADGSSRDITAEVGWQVSTPSVVSVSGGIVTALGPGAATITALAGAVFSNPITLTVNISPPATLQSILISAPVSSLSPGQVVLLMAIGNYSDGSSQDITGLVLWSSNAPTVLQVTPGGAATGLTPGTAVVTAALLAITSNPVTLDILPITLTSLTISGLPPQLNVGESVPLSATAGYSDGSAYDVTPEVVWSMTNLLVATIFGNVLVALADGAGGLFATWRGLNSPIVPFLVVTPIESITVGPSDLTLFVGEETPVVALNPANLLDITNLVTWEVNPPGIASITDGVLRALASGDGYFLARSGAITSNFALFKIMDIWRPGDLTVDSVTAVPSSLASGDLAITITINGAAPKALPFRLTIVFVAPSGTRSMMYDVDQLFPGPLPYVFQETFVVPEGIETGTYAVEVTLSGV